MTWISALFFIWLLTISRGQVFRRFRYGILNGTVVTDGPVLFNTNPFLVPDATVQNSYAEVCRKINPITLQQNVLVLDVPRIGRVIVDTGSRFDVPSEFSPDSGKLFENLVVAGISPESIDHVLLTHGHPDHVSGIRLPGGGRAFPNAQIYISRTEHEFWSNPPTGPNSTDTIPEAVAFFSFRYLSAIGDYTDRLNLVRNNGSPLPFVRFIFGPGHSPGHSAILFKAGFNKRFIVAGDTWITRADQLENPEWGFEFETDRSDARRSRERLLARAASYRALVLAYHEDFPGLGFVKRSGIIPRTYNWVPASDASPNCKVE